MEDDELVVMEDDELGVECELLQSEVDAVGIDDDDLLLASHGRRRYEIVKNPRTSIYTRGAESHQYEQNESEVWWHHQLQRYLLDSINTPEVASSLISS